MRVRQISETLDDWASNEKSDRKYLVYFIRLICNKLLVIIKEFFFFFRCLVDFVHTCFNNLHYFVLHNPPAVLFIFNIALFIVVLSIATISLTVSEHIKSPLEWRNFLDDFSQLELCIIPFKSNTTFGNTNHLPPVTPDSSLENNVLMTYYIPVHLSIHPIEDFFSINSSQFSLSTSMYGKYMGFKGAYSQTIINITLSFNHNFNASCCRDMVQTGCVSFTGPGGVFPKDKHMDQCEPHASPSLSTYRAGLNWQLADVNALYYCRSRTIIKGTFESFLTAPKFSLREVRPETRIHLFDTIIFLFLVLLVCFLYASIYQHQRPQRLSRHSSLNHSLSED